KELEWIRTSPKGRRAKNKARISNYEIMLSDGSKAKNTRLQIPIPNGPRLGNKVLEVKNLQKSFGDKLLIDGLTFELPPAGIVGIVGPNGAGKTTLFKMIMGEETPDKGDLSLGDTVKIGYVDQTHKDIDPEATVWEVVSGKNEHIEIGGELVNSRAYVSRFNFNGPDQQKKCKVLSGGERNRLHLAMTLKTEANVLLLDEPTNDIDVNTLRALEEGILAFAGCAVVISHDRYFLDRICTHILAFEGDSNVVWFEGVYSDYEENKKKRLVDKGPKRIKYRKLVRG
ncbi:ATP-binding cassette domain-containing protein, partial [Flavobacteriales bacterium]|nr:ATP-binding cassette domain-containing protein [Flavobacteriales bacterium]